MRSREGRNKIIMCKKGRREGGEAEEMEMRSRESRNRNIMFKRGEGKEERLEKGR